MATAENVMDEVKMTEAFDVYCKEGMKDDGAPEKDWAPFCGGYRAGHAGCVKRLRESAENEGRFVAGIIRTEADCLEEPHPQEAERPDFELVGEKCERLGAELKTAKAHIAELEEQLEHAGDVMRGYEGEI